MSYVQERYRPSQIAANTVNTIPGASIGGFLCVTSGNIQIQTNDVTPKTIVPTLAVTAGVYYPFPFVGSHTGLIITTTGGASGVLAVD